MVQITANNYYGANDCKSDVNKAQNQVMQYTSFAKDLPSFDEESPSFTEELPSFTEELPSFAEYFFLGRLGHRVFTG